jgi:hypothetical protein
LKIRKRGKIRKRRKKEGKEGGKDIRYSNHKVVAFFDDNIRKLVAAGRWR